MKFNKRIIVPILAVAAFASLGIGSTYAIFTSNAETNIAVTAGKVSVKSEIQNLKLYSGVYNETTGVYDPVEQTSAFLNGGTATVDGAVVRLDKMTPMDKAEFDIVITNESNVAIKYRTLADVLTDDGLVAGLDITIDGVDFDGTTQASKWTSLAAGVTDIATKHVVVSLPEDAGNGYQEKKASLEFAVSAVQGNANTVDADDSIDYPLYTVNDLLKFAASYNANPAPYAGKTVALMDNMSLKDITWTPIQGGNNGVIFDGQGFTVSDMTLTGTANVGFFGCGVGFTIKNLNFNNCNVTGVNHVAVVAGDGLCTYIENCKVTNSVVTVNDSGDATNGYDDGDKAGAICGYLSAEQNAYVKNCTVSDTTISAYRDIGAIVGMANGASVVSGNTIGSNVVLNVLHCGTNDMNYKSYTTEAAHNADQYAGRKSGEETLENNTGTAKINYIEA